MWNEEHDMSARLRSTMGIGEAGADVVPIESMCEHNRHLRLF